MNSHPRMVRWAHGLLVVLIVLVLAGLTACEAPRPAARTPFPTGVSPEATPPVVPPGTPALAQFSSVPARTIGDQPDIVPGQVILKLQLEPAVQALDAERRADGIMSTGLPDIDGLNQQFGVQSFEPLVQPVAQAAGEGVRTFAERQPALLGLYVVSFDPQYDPNDVATAYAATADVIYAEPNFYAYADESPWGPVAFAPNDPFFRFQWHMPLIQAPEAWDVANGNGVLVAVLDTGIAYEDFDVHRQAPDLSSTRFLPGYDFINDDDHANDDEGHGTHVAGTVAQSTNNGQGVAGVAFGATLMPVKVLDSQGQGSYDTIAQGIIYAADRGARIITMSLSGRNPSKALAEAISHAVRKGVLLVAAAGNSGGSVEYPAAYDDVLAVGSVGFNRVRADYSNFGPELDLVAPGGDTDADLNGDNYPDGVLQQTFRGDPTSFGFYYYEGTSMAAPHVAGVAALLFEYSPGASADQVRNAMQSTAMDLGPGGRDNEYGHGLVQARQALAAIGGPQPITPTPTFTPSPTPIGPTPSPTPTFTPTPTGTPPPASGDLIVNGGFESDGGWIFSRTAYPADFSTQVVHGGARSARVGIVDGVDRFAYSSVHQSVTIPADARRATLTYWVYPLSGDVYPTDQQLVLVLNEQFRVIRDLDRTLSDGRQWIQRSHDMMPFAGRTVLIYFGVVNRGGSGQTSGMYVDDVSLTFER